MMQLSSLIVCFFRPHLVVTCEEGQFQCPGTGLCFSNEVLCDNFTDCPGGFDEQNCTGKNVTNQISYCCGDFVMIHVLMGS